MRHTDPRKGRQLCRQVARIVSLSLAESTDPILQQLVVADVLPHPGGGQLDVLLVWGGPPHEVAVGDILQRLANARGWLRSEVAGGIHRRRVPQLSFVVTEPG